MSKTLDEMEREVKDRDRDEGVVSGGQGEGKEAGVLRGKERMDRVRRGGEGEWLEGERVSAII